MHLAVGYMSRIHKYIFIAAFYVAALIFPVLLLANDDGALPGLMAAPGEGNCTSCHTGTALNGGGGAVKIMLPNGSTNYMPGVTQRVQVEVSDPTQRRWGFELSARVGSSTVQAGTLASADRNTQLESSGGVQYVTHTRTGTRNGTNGGVTFEFDWTPPSTDVGTVTLYAAGNAANGNNQDTGDHIYTTSLALSPAAATSNTPTINSDRGVVNGASFQSGIAPGTWITITGTNLASTTREWSASDFVDGKLPISLDGVSVTVDGKAAFIRYVSPGQIHALVPDDESRGDVQVSITVDGQGSNSITSSLQSFSPAFFTFDGKYVAATHADNTLLGPSGLFSSSPAATTPAKPGETIILYGIGFGTANPAVPPGQFTDSVASITTPFTITIGGLPATVSFGGLIPPYAQLYQFNIEVPAAVADGDQAVVAQIGGVTSTSTAACCFVTVQR